MGRLAAAVSLFGIALAAALLGLMFAANEASKEGHIKGKVSVDLNNNPVETKPLQSFGSLMTFPQMTVAQLNQLDYVSFSVMDGSQAVDMRYRVSAWTRAQTSKLTTLLTQDGSTISIQGDGSSASVQTSSGTYSIAVPASQRRRLMSDQQEGRGPQLFGSMEEMAEHMGIAEEQRRLSFHGALMTSGKSVSDARKLGFGGALMTSGKGERRLSFAGSLMTSGNGERQLSFTGALMTSGEEERKLGFAGSLMTSGEEESASRRLSFNGALMTSGRSGCASRRWLITPFACLACACCVVLVVLLTSMV